MKTLIDAVIQYLEEAYADEIVRLQGALNKQLGNPNSLSVNTSLAMRVKKYYIANEYNALMTVKYIINETGMGIRDSKEWFDEFIKPIKPAQYLIICSPNDDYSKDYIYGTVDSLDIAEFIVEEMQENETKAVWFYVPLKAVDRAELQRIKAEQREDNTHSQHKGWSGQEG
jgi:hypothetical protein